MASEGLAPGRVPAETHEASQVGQRLGYRYPQKSG
jgi:hypothetical protein